MQPNQSLYQIYLRSVKGYEMLYQILHIYDILAEEIRDEFEPVPVEPMNDEFFLENSCIERVKPMRIKKFNSSETSSSLQYLYATLNLKKMKNPESDF